VKNGLAPFLQRLVQEKRIVDLGVVLLRPIDKKTACWKFDESLIWGHVKGFQHTLVRVGNVFNLTYDELAPTKKNTTSGDEDIGTKNLTNVDDNIIRSLDKKLLSVFTLYYHIYICVLNFKIYFP